LNRSIVLILFLSWFRVLLFCIFKHAKTEEKIKTEEREIEAEKEKNFRCQTTTV